MYSHMRRNLETTTCTHIFDWSSCTWTYCSII